MLVIAKPPTNYLTTPWERMIPYTCKSCSHIICQSGQYRVHHTSASGVFAMLNARHLQSLEERICMREALAPGM